MLATVLVVLAPALLGGEDREQPVAAPPSQSALAAGSQAPRPSPTPEPATTTPQAPPPPSPAKPDVPQSGTDHFKVANFARPAPQRGGRLVKVRFEVEDNLAVDPDAAAQEAADVLQDGRSWTGKGAGVRFDFVGNQPAELTIGVMTPDTTDRHCLPLRTLGQVSCSVGNKVNLNARRWVTAVDAYGDDVPDYRRYLVNHEVGHFLGHGHVGCPGPGKPAPVMMQQTKGLDGCARNPWP